MIHTYFRHLPLLIVLGALWAQPNLASAQTAKPAAKATAKPAAKPSATPAKSDNPDRTKPLDLSLTEAINLALRNNPNVASANLQRIIDKYALVVANNEFEWRYRFVSSYFWNKQTRRGSTDRSQGGNLTPEASIKSPVGLEFSASLPQQFNDGSKYEPALKVTAHQPLLRGSGSKVNLVPLQNSYDQEAIAKLNLKNTIMNTVNTVVRNYRSVQESQWSVQIQESNLKDAKENLAQTQAKIDAGQLPPRDIVEIRRQIADQELQLEIAKNSHDQNVLVLLQDMWIDPQAKLALPNDIDTKLDDIPNLEESYQTALLYNIDYQIALYNLEQRKRAVTVAEDDQRWRLDLNASHTFGGGDGDHRNHNSFNRFFDGQNDETRVELNLEIPIDDKPRKQTLVNAKTQLKQDYLHIELRKRALYDDIKIAIQNIKSERKQVTLAEEATDLARQSLDLEKRKQLHGKATNLDVTSARRTLIESENALVRSKIKYLNTLTEFRHLLGITLEYWQVEVSY